MDDGACRRGDRQRHRLGNRVRDRNGFDLEGADGEFLARPVDRDRYFRRALLALPLGFQQAGAERRHPDRRLQLRPCVEQRAVMVFMRMRDDDAAQIGEVLLDEACVGQHQVDARQAGIGEGHSDIDDNPFARAGRPVAVKSEVHADLADAAERHEDEFGVFRFRHDFSLPGPQAKLKSNSGKSV